jgi:sugar phosphate isomerase/epimerase
MIGFSSPPMTVWPFRDAAETILPRFDLWEIISEANHFLPDIRGELKILMETTNLKVSIHAPFSDVNLAAFDRATRKYSFNLFLEIFGIASEMDIGVVTIHPGVIGPVQYWDQPRVNKLTRESLEEISAIADEFSTLIALENMPEMRFATCKTTREMEQMLEGLDLTMCFDIGHANLTGQLPEMCRLDHLFSNVHIHDNDGQKDKHWQLGQGTVHFKDIIGRLGSYSGNYIIEAKSTDMDGATASRRFLESILD